MFYTPITRLALLSVSAMPLIAGILFAERGHAEERHNEQISQAEILWDQFGIPHIYGPDVLSVVRGLGYAEMENHAETILINAAYARGRAAEYFGAGTNNVNVQNDITVRTENIPARAQTWLDMGGEKQAEIIKAFIDGANQYALLHGNTISPVFAQILPLVPADITSGIQNITNFTVMPSQDNIPALISAWQAGGLAAANAVARNFTPTGSNGWALAPKKSESGNAILMGNPHLPWGNNTPLPGLGKFQLMEVNLVVGERDHPDLNASGVVFAGAPFIAIGYSDDVGWTHTNNTIQNTNLYELSLNANGTYTYGGAEVPLQVRSDSIKVLQPGGSYVSLPIEIFSSVQGPIIAQSADKTKALALRVAGLDQPSVVSQYWGMIEAHNLGEFIAANSALQMPFYNVVYADRDGHIMYLFGGQQPVRHGGDWAKYDGILDGSDPSLVWNRTFSWRELPRAIDPEGGFVANSNNPPWTSSFPQTGTNNPGNFPAYVAPQFMDLRAQHGALFLQSQHKFTPAEVLAGKESTYFTLADRILPDLIAAAQASGNPVAQKAAAVLAGWDRTAEPSSKGAVLFEAWYGIVYQDPNVVKDTTIDFYTPHPEFRVGWTPSDPLHTPYGLAYQPQLLVDLVEAAQGVLANFGALDVAWGDVHKIVLATHNSTFTQTIPLTMDPQSGADDPFGPLRVIYRTPALDGSNHFWAYEGDGYVQVVEFTRHGANAGALLSYGNASRPGSSHVTDQLHYFDEKQLRPTYRSREDVESHTVLRETVSGEGRFARD